ncbi:hypothetical protein Ahy_A03g014919 [Arachis hypogaea]|uniref:Uncharacterized protein n=1 Tax=Arachis hypogaea TaxID=3818 RepID=A0A445DZ43_ARAHY|nr:hypothetical protein Ahy_A03g014919 [Arachis hypogaea]
MVENYAPSLSNKRIKEGGMLQPKGASCGKLAMIESNPDGKLYWNLKMSLNFLQSCDVIRSPIAKWMGFPEANYVGYCDFRGLASYSEGQSYRPRVNYIYGGRWVCARYIPVSPTTVYWFICFNSSSSGPK